MADETKHDQPTAKTGLDLLREPFPPNLIGKLPKPTKRQTEEVKRDFKKGIRCTVCGQWHHPKVVHLDYVGHAALTDRLLDCDLEWAWEPLSLDQHGLPLFDESGGLWIKLTVCGVTRLGYGDAQGKTGGDAIKEAIGDALRNAGMRFGAALELWHKGDLHAQHDEPQNGGGAVNSEPTFMEGRSPQASAALPKAAARELYSELQTDIDSADSRDALKAWSANRAKDIDSMPPDWKQKLRDRYAERMLDLEYGPEINHEEREHVQ